MKLSETNNYLGLIVNVAVLASIVFLVVELRQNSNIARTSEYRENIQNINDWRTTLAENEELNRIFQLYLDGKYLDLEEGQRERVKYMVNNVLGIYENAYVARQNGIMDEEGWQRFHLGACLHFDIAVVSGLPGFFTEDFRQYLDVTCN